MGIVDISGVSEDALNIVDLMDNILADVVATFESYAVPLPSRRYWTVGQSAIDCEQLTLALTQGFLGSPGNQLSEPQRCTVPRSVVVLITVAREVPVVGVNGRPPAADKITEGSKIAAVDAWVLLQSLNAFDQWEQYGLGLGVIATVEFSPPEGGFQLVTMELTIGVP